MTPQPQILIVDDDPGTLFGFSQFLTHAGYTVTTASTLTDARVMVSSQRFHAILLDLNLPDGNGIEWIEELRGSYPDVAIVVITGIGNISIAVDAMRRGADNFLAKPVNMDDVDVFLRKSLELGSLRRKHLTSQRLENRHRPFFGDAPTMKHAMELAALAADNDSPVLIQGETGTGKGVLARWIHGQSPRRNGFFVEVNCSSLKGDLLLSELFGHARGSFTSAVKDRQGLLEVADEGTLFLDEIGDMDIETQAQFLKVIEEKRYRRVGEDGVRKSDFRLICATNKDLLDEVRKKIFRLDLYYRIYVFPILLPPLRERQEDIPGLIRHILEDLGSANCAVSPEAMSMLQSYAWPGNTRELRNVLERALILAHQGPITPDNLRGLTRTAPAPAPHETVLPLERMEMAHIKSVLESCHGDTRKAADALGISRATLYRKLKKISVRP